MRALVAFPTMTLALHRMLAQAAQDQLVPLMSEAAFKGDVATMERLVAKGASVNQHDQVTGVAACPPYPAPPPALTCLMHTLDMTEIIALAMVLARPPTLAQERMKITTHQRSFLDGQASISNISLCLVRNGAEQYDRTPLHFAAFNGHMEAVKWLIHKNADVNVAGMVSIYSPFSLTLTWVICLHELIKTQMLDPHKSAPQSNT